MASLAANFSVYRVSWAAVVSLLRAVGHVLQKVDGPASPTLAKAIADHWRSWKADPSAHAIFGDFIEKERNNVLKQYTFGYTEDSVEVHSTGADGVTRVYQAVPFHMRIHGGRFDGQDGLDVARSAAQWWQAQLDAIEADTKA